MKATVEKHAWLEIFLHLYAEATPSVRLMTNLDRIKAGEMPVRPHILVGDILTVQPILEAAKEIPQPREKELQAIRREFELALSSCINAGKSAVKYIKVDPDATEAQIQFSKILNSIVLAHEYFGSVSKRLASFLVKSTSNTPIAN